MVFHAHQKLDRVAHRHLSELIVDTKFPTTKQILHFEAGHGPDNVKLKRRVGQQPWHFVDPDDADDKEIEQHIKHHYEGLVSALGQADEIRAAFEAAWLAHALVDGLTPAHHYPYEQELEALRGEGRDTRKGLAGRIYVKGDTLSHSLVRSIKLVGPKGLLTNHTMFEAGAYSLIAPLRLSRARPTPAELEQVRHQGVTKTFRRLAKEVAGYKIYERFILKGWTASVSRDVRHELAPRMVKMITLAWYAACRQAEESKS